MNKCAKEILTESASCIHIPHLAPQSTLSFACENDRKDLNSASGINDGEKVTAQLEDLELQLSDQLDGKTLSVGAHDFALRRQEAYVPDVVLREKKNKNLSGTFNEGHDHGCEGNKTSQPCLSDVSSDDFQCRLYEWIAQNFGDDYASLSPEDFKRLSATFSSSSTSEDAVDCSPQNDAESVLYVAHSNAVVQQLPIVSSLVKKHLNR